MTIDRIRVAPKPLRTAAAAILRAIGLTDDHAADAAEVLVATDLRGIESHGVNMLRSYLQQFRDGLLNPKPDWRVIREAPATATIDADRALGISIGRKLMEMAMEKAHRFGTGMVSVANCGHLGAVGHFAMLATRQEMVGVCMTASSGGVGVLPTFGAEPRLARRRLCSSTSRRPCPLPTRCISFTKRARRCRRDGSRTARAGQ